MHRSSPFVGGSLQPLASNMNPRMNASAVDPLHFQISGQSALSHEVRARGFTFFRQLAEYVQALPYGRTTGREDPRAVLYEKRGTCSSKHQLLAAVAQASGRAEIQLTVGIYAMCEENTPGVAATLSTAGVASIPEAHCYLSVQGKRMDFTGLAAGNSSPFGALISESVVHPSRLHEAKSELHMQALAEWASARGTTAEWAWSVREACIAALAARHFTERTDSSQLRQPAAAPARTPAQHKFNQQP